MKKNSEEDNFSERVNLCIGDKVLITKSDINWGGYMNAFIGDIVTIRDVKFYPDNIGEGAIRCKFDWKYNDWAWFFDQHHFIPVFFKRDIIGS